LCWYRTWQSLRVRTGLFYGLKEDYFIRIKNKDS